MFSQTISETIEELGQFGDSFGGLNALFSALALGGVIWSIVLQRKELRETRLEFRQQNETLTRQRFENTFFKLLELKNSFIQSMTVKTSIHQTLNGIYALRNIAERWTDTFHTYYSSGFSENDLTDSRLKIPNTELVPYFGVLYQILRCVEASQLTAREKEEFYDIVRSTLSPEEQSCVFYRALLSDDDLSQKLIELSMLPDDISIPLHASYAIHKNAWAILKARHSPPPPQEPQCNKTQVAQEK